MKISKLIFLKSYRMFLKELVTVQVEARIYCVFTYQSVNFDCSKPFAEGEFAWA